MGRKALAGGHVALLEVAWNNINFYALTFVYVCLALIKHVCVSARCSHMSHMPISDDIEKPQCVLCHAVLSAERQ